MLYLEDYLELIEHLPQELRDRLTYIRESDLKVNNSSLQLDAKVKQFFAQAKDLNDEQRQCEYESILNEFQKTKKFADEKVDTSTQIYDVMVMLVRKLDTELEKFKLGLEADHAGITEELNASVQNNKISKKSTSLKGNDIIYSNNPFDRQNPLAAAASQAIAATHQLNLTNLPTPVNVIHTINSTQLQQGRKTLSLKASFAAINAAGLNFPLDSTSRNRQDVANRNALAPMAPDHQSFSYNQHGRQEAQDDTNPLYMPITKSGRATKRPKHRASHLYPDESPTSISWDNSVFENSESLSSVDFIETGTNFGSTSPSSIDFNNTTNDADAALNQKDKTKYCLCRQISYGEMVACDNEECQIEWFHYGCVGITQSPKGKWYCPECRPLLKPMN